MVEQWLDYLLGTLPPAEIQRIEAHLQNHPDDRAELEAIRAALNPPQDDAPTDQPPADLHVRTIAHIASFCVAQRDDFPSIGRSIVETPLPDHHASIGSKPYRALSSASMEPEMGPSRWSRRNVIVAAVMVLMTIGVTVPGVRYAQQQQQLYACQDQLRGQHLALNGYADVHDGWYPKIQTVPPNDTARSYLTQLIQSGNWPEKAGVGNPMDSRSSHDPIAYAYTLGFRDENGQLIGYHRSTDGESDHLPILADRPANPTERGLHRGQNVLYLGGHVRPCQDSHVGIAGDEIYTSERGQVEAGLHRWDSVLGWDSASP